ncbi:hypothetical protein FOPG_20049 [Fusarium oxysporum f. sp. conglutinans race 2 54008]|uniref:Uncharacterized protein n=1 Tax=Fusarium oxysporum f. sp. conglutinans race 2 54008 TaxID=1089457 RepID=X0GK39_FUSOX|nr:hypothetical protein FOPG_20049 [Fusarium oxysporum f. sp. conglutinans race 2 54008]
MQSKEMQCAYYVGPFTLRKSVVQEENTHSQNCTIVHTCLLGSPIFSMAINFAFIVKIRRNAST